MQTNFNSIETKSFAKFGNEFQIDLIRSFFHNHEFFVQIYDILEDEFFTYELAKWFLVVFKTYYTKYQTLPSFNDIKTIINQSESDVRPILLRELSSIEKSKDRSFSYVNDQALSFCKSQRLKQGVEKVYELVKKSEEDGLSRDDDILSLMSNVINAGSSRDIGHDYMRDIHERHKHRARNPVPTPWKAINKYIGGGLAGGELSIVMAPTRVGKSHFLVSIGACALMNNYNVLHYTLELSEYYVALRYDSNITQIAIDDLHKNFDTIKDKLSSIRERGGQLLIKEYPAKSPTTQTIRSHISKMSAQGFKPDIIIIDYLDLLNATHRYEQKRYELENIVEELRGIAQEFKVPVWTASQVNRAGVNQSVITLDFIAEGFSKAFVADVVISLARPSSGDDSNKGNGLIAKNRVGLDGIVLPMIVDTSTSSFIFFDTTGQSPEDLNETQMKKNILAAYDKTKKKRKNNDKENEE